MKALFHIGDEVICVDSKPNRIGKPSGLIEGKKYIINDVYFCSGCGQTKVTVGIMENFVTSLCPCGCSSRPFFERLYFQTRFIKPETDHQLEEQIHESLKGIKIEN